MPSKVNIEFYIPSHDREWLQFSLDLAYDINCRLLRQFKEIPLPNPEFVKFDTTYNLDSTDCINALIMNGKGECKDFACAVAAYYTVRMGIEARPIVIPLYKNGEQIKGKWHAVISLKGVEFDPNYLYGMTKGQR